MEAQALIREYGEIILAWARTSGLKVIVILVGCWLLVRFTYVLVNRIRVRADDGNDEITSEREKRAATLASVLRQVVRFSVGGLAVVMVLHEFRIDIAPLIAGAGIVGLAVGFGAQSVVKDVISGFFILLENQFDVGDSVMGAGVSGTVERMNLRYTQLRDMEGRVHFIPNGEFRVVSNLTRGFSQAVLDIGVAYSADLEQVQRILGEIAEGMKKEAPYTGLMLEPMRLLGIESFGESAINIRMLFKTVPGRQWDVAREFRRRVKIRFDALGIELPGPQRVLVTAGLQAPARPAEPPPAAAPPSRS